MTLEDIRELVAAIDPLASRYESANNTRESYTVWNETRMLGLMREDRHEPAWAFQIHYFTKRENDTMANAIFAALEADYRVAFEYLQEYEQDTGYIHHIYSCEGV